MEYDVLLSMLEKREFKELKDELENMHPVDIVEMLEDGLEYGKIDKRQMILLFRLLAKEEAAEVFTDMTSDTREVLINALTDSELEEVMEEMYVDDTVDVLEEMPANVVDRLLMATDEETRQKINALLNYPEDSAGSIMNIDYISLNKEMTVADAILKIRQVGINKETIYTCYVTEKKKLIGVVDVKDILTSGESRKIEEIMDENVIYAKTLDDQEEVAEPSLGLTPAMILISSVASSCKTNIASSTVTIPTIHISWSMIGIAISPYFRIVSATSS